MSEQTSLPSNAAATSLVIARPLVVVAEELSSDAAQWLARTCTVESASFETPRFSELITTADALIVRTYARVDQALLARAPRLKVVARAGVGLDRIDVAACRARGVEVVHTPDANSQAVAEFVFALLHDAMRPRLLLESAVDAPRWNVLRKELVAPRQLSELTFGILGLGRIGTRVARIAGAYGAKVLYHDILEIPAARREGAVSVSRDVLLRSSDVLSIHVDPRPQNHEIVGTDFVSQLKPTAIIINTARGLLMDAAAVAAFLWANPRAAALIDVHDPEPFGPSYSLLGLQNAHLTPHLAAATQTAHENMSWVVRDVLRVLQGQPPEFPAPQ